MPGTVVVVLNVRRINRIWLRLGSLVCADPVVRVVRELHHE